MALRLAEVKGLLQALLHCAVVGVLSGLASFVFLQGLDVLTDLRVANAWIVFLLPVAGYLFGSAHERYGKDSMSAMNQIVKIVHAGGSRLSPRLPLWALFGTWLTHVFGGSAGREGTAVQMGSGLAEEWSSRFRLSSGDRQLLLLSGMAGGFGSVFGTPLAGAVFALEMKRGSRATGHRWGTIGIACGFASFLGDVTARILGADHGIFPRALPEGFRVAQMASWLGLAAAVAACAWAYVFLVENVKKWGQRYLGSLPRRMALGGCLVVVVSLSLGTHAYLGLGVPGIHAALRTPQSSPEPFAWKLVFTAVTVGSGFLGGEVTPLFFVGASLGSWLAGPLGLSPTLAASVGLASVFGAAARAPLALSVMAYELFGPFALLPTLLVSLLASSVLGRHRIYEFPIVSAEDSGPAPSAASEIHKVP